MGLTKKKRLKKFKKSLKRVKYLLRKLKKSLKKNHLLQRKTQRKLKIKGGSAAGPVVAAAAAAAPAAAAPGAPGALVKVGGPAAVGPIEAKLRALIVIKYKEALDEAKGSRLTDKERTALAGICLANILQEMFDWDDGNSNQYAEDIRETMTHFSENTNILGADDTNVLIRGLTRRLNGLPKGVGWRKFLGRVADAEQCKEILGYYEKNLKGFKRGTASRDLQMWKIDPHGYIFQSRDRASTIFKGLNPQHNPKCYICGFDLFPGEGKQRTPPDPAQNIIECEHLIAFMAALALYNVYNINVNDLSDADRMILSQEYYWSHRCCNQKKSNLPFITFDSSLGEYIINDKYIDLLLKRIEDGAKRYKAHNIPRKDPSVKVAGIDQECYELLMRTPGLTLNMGDPEVRSWRARRRGALQDDPKLKKILEFANEKIKYLNNNGLTDSFRHVLSVARILDAHTPEMLKELFQTNDSKRKLEQALAVELAFKQEYDDKLVALQTQISDWMKNAFGYTSPRTGFTISQQGLASATRMTSLIFKDIRDNYFFFKSSKELNTKQQKALLDSLKYIIDVTTLVRAKITAPARSSGFRKMIQKEFAEQLKILRTDPKNGINKVLQDSISPSAASVALTLKGGGRGGANRGEEGRSKIQHRKADLGERRNKFVARTKDGRRERQIDRAANADFQQKRNECLEKTNRLYEESLTSEYEMAEDDALLYPSAYLSKQEDEDFDDEDILMVQFVFVKPILKSILALESLCLDLIEQYNLKSTTFFLKSGELFQWKAGLLHNSFESIPSLAAEAEKYWPQTKFVEQRTQTLSPYHFNKIKAVLPNIILEQFAEEVADKFADKFKKDFVNVQRKGSFNFHMALRKPPFASSVAPSVASDPTFGNPYPVFGAAAPTFGAAPVVAAAAADAGPAPAPTPTPSFGYPR